MDTKKQHQDVCLSLISHKLKTCDAEAIIPQGDSKGGSIEFEIAINTPDDGTELFVEKKAAFEIKVECVAKLKETEEIAFKISASMQGLCQVVGVKKSVRSDSSLWEYPIRTLFPLLSQYVSDTAMRMGYINVFIPLTLPMDLHRPKASKLSKKK